MIGLSRRDKSRLYIWVLGLSELYCPMTATIAIKTVKEKVLKNCVYKDRRLPPFCTRVLCKGTTSASLLSRATRISSPAANKLAIIEFPP